MAESPTSALQKVTRNTAQKCRAAVLVAEDDLTDEQIASEVGVTRQTLHKWKQNQDFAALVGDHVGQIQAGMLRLAIARKHKRVAVLDDLHNRALQVVIERAARHSVELAEADSPDRAVRRMFGDNVPTEAATGLMVRQESVNASGMKTVNWSVDTGLIKEIRALHEQAAKELGQWEETVNLNHSGLTRQYVIVTEDDE